MTKQERRKAARAARERIDERLPLSPDGMPDYPRQRLPLSPDGMPDYPEQGAPEARERIDERLPPATPPTAREWRAEGEEQRPGMLDAMPPAGLPVISASKRAAEPIVEAKYMRRVDAGSGEYGPRQDLDLTDYTRSRPMSMREAAEAGLFEDSTPRGVEMDPADKVRAGFMRPFAERGQEARPGVTTRRQVDEILQRLERAREMDSRQMDVQAGGAGEQFRRGLAETRDLRWGASGPTSAVNRAIAERRAGRERTDEAIRLAKALPPPQAGAAKPLTPSQAGALIMRRASLLQGDGVTPLRPEAMEEARKIDELLSAGGYGGLRGDEPDKGGAAGKEEAGGAAGKGQPGERVWNAKYKAYYIRQPDGTWKRERR